MSTVGYVVVEFNQASGAPSIAYNGDVFYTIEDAEDYKQQCEAETSKVGRHERYAVATIETEDEA